MSLIADALAAAQRERGQPGGTSRRLIAASVVTRDQSRGVFARRAVSLPRSLGLATAVFAFALVAAASLVAVAPTQAPRPRPAAPRRAAPPAVAVDTAPVAGDSVVAPAVTAPLPGVVATVSAPGSAPIVALRASDAEPAPVAVAAPQPTRFQITVEPTVASVDALVADAVAAHRRGDLATAISLYERAVVLSPRDAQALKNLGSAYQAAGQPAPARDAFRRALDASPRDAAAWSSLGAVLGALGQVAEAEAALGESIRLDPSNGGAKVNLANHYLARGLTADARRLLDEVVLDAPTHPEAHYALGRLLETQGDREGAVRHYRSFLEHGGGRFPQLEGPVRRRIEQLGGQ